MRWTRTGPAFPGSASSGSSSWRPSVSGLLPIDMPTIHSDTETRKQLDELELVYQSITSYRPPVSSPPILDSSLDAPINHDNDHMSGLRPLLEAVKRDLDVAKQVQPPRLAPTSRPMNLVVSFFTSSFWRLQTLLSCHHPRQMHHISLPYGRKCYPLHFP